MLNSGHDQQLVNTCVAAVVAMVAASGFQFYTHRPFTFFSAFFMHYPQCIILPFPVLTANSRAGLTCLHVLL